MSEYQDAIAIYQQQFKRLCGSKYLVFPWMVHIETLALCPAACSFCPYPGLTRKGERMEDSLIDKIIHDLQEVPRNLPLRIFPGKVNEPFMDPRLIGIMKKINDALPNAGLLLFTNAAPLTEAKLHELNEVTQFQLLTISLHEYRAEEYTRLMQLPWERTQEKLQLMHRLKSEGNFPVPVQLLRVCDGSQHDQAFLVWCKQKYPLFHPVLLQRGSWLKQVNGLRPVVMDPISDVLYQTDEDSIEIPEIGCLHWFEVSIAATGEVAYCCMDGELKYPQGNVNHQHLLDIYNQPSLRRLRQKALNRSSCEPCNPCSFL